MKKNLLFALILFAASVSVRSQIQSTIFGGYWHDPNTWVGLAVPGENDDVVINGPVVQAYASGYDILPVHCKDLTLNSSGSLRNGGYGGGYGVYPVYVHGSVVNDGLVENGPEDALKMFVYGDLTNNNIWRPLETELMVSENHNLSLAVGKTLGSKIIVAGTASITAVTDLVFTCDWYLEGGYNRSHLLLNGQTFNVGNHALEMRNCLINSGTLTGDFEILGTFSVGYDISDTLKFEGNILVTDTLMANVYGGGYGIYKLLIDGNLTNNGVVKDNMDTDAPLNDDDLEILITGNITNNGWWSCRYIRLIGNETQYLSQEPGNFFDSYFYDLDPVSEIVTQTDITVLNDFDLNGANLNMAGNTLTIWGWLQDGTIDNANLNNGYLNSITSTGNLTINGVVTIENNNIFQGNVLVNDTLQSIEYGGGSTSFTLQVLGDITNSGLIRNINDGDVLSLEITGNIDNQGTWENSYTRFTGTQPQNIQQVSGKMFRTNFSDTDSVSIVVATSDLKIAGDFNLMRSTLQMSHHEINISGYLHNGTVRSAIIKNATLNNVTAFDNVEIRGVVVIDSGNKFFGDLLVTDTLQSQVNYGGYFIYSLYNYGNLENNGLIRNEPIELEPLALYIQGDIINRGRFSNFTNYQLFYLNDDIHQVSCLNTGTANWQFDGSSITGAGANSYLMVSGGGDQTISPGQSYDVDVQFTPSGSDFTAALNLNCSELGSLSTIYLIGYNENSTVGLVENEAALYGDHSFMLQNYPNPFSETTTLSWQLVSQTRVVIKVFDFSGKEISTLVDCEQDSGKHEFRFDASGLPSGIYFVWATFNNGIAVRKLVRF